MSLKKQAITSIIWDFLGKISIQGSNFIVSIFLARLLSPTDFGLVALVMVVLNILSIFMDVGLSSGLIQRRRVLPIHFYSVFYFNLFFAVFLTLITFFSSGHIAIFFKQPELKLLIEVMSIIFVINSFGSIHRVILIKNLQYKILTKVNFFSFLIGGIVGIVLALNNFGVWSLVFQNIIGNILGTVLLWKYSLWRPKFLFSLKALIQLWSFGFKMFLAAVIDKVFSQLDYLVIGKIFSPATLGYFQRAKSLNSLIISYSSGSIMQVMFPVLSKIQNDLERFRNVVLKVLAIICFMVFFLIGFFYLNAKEVIVLLFSDKWLPSVEMFKILVLSAFAFPISALLVNILSSRGNSTDFLKLDIYKKISLSLVFFIGFHFGIYGFLYGLIYQAFFAVFINAVYAAKEIKLDKKIFFKVMLHHAIVGVLGVIITYFIIQFLKINNLFLSLIFKGLIFSVVYLLFSFIFKVDGIKIIIEEIKKFFKGRKNA